MGVFTQRFEALFHRAEALGWAVCFALHRSSWFICAWMWGRGVLPATLPAPFSATLSLAFSVYLCAIVGPQDLLVVRLSAPLLRQSRSGHGHVSPLSPGAHLGPTYPSGWMFTFYFLGFGLPCRSIFCQFWLCEEAQCVYLCRHLGSRLYSFQVYNSMTHHLITFVFLIGIFRNFIFNVRMINLTNICHICNCFLFIPRHFLPYFVWVEHFMIPFSLFWKWINYTSF